MRISEKVLRRRGRLFLEKNTLRRQLREKIDSLFLVRISLGCTMDLLRRVDRHAAINFVPTGGTPLRLFEPG